MIEPLDLATRAIHAIDCEPDCREELTTCGRYGRYARAALDAVRHIELLAENERLTGELAEARRERDGARTALGEAIGRSRGHELNVIDLLGKLAAARAERDRYRAIIERARKALDAVLQDAAVDAQGARAVPLDNLIAQTSATDPEFREAYQRAAQQAASGRTDPAERPQTHQAATDAPRAAETVLPCSRCGANPPINPRDRYPDGRPTHFARFCAECIDRCHESTDFAHECAVCADATERGEATT